MHQAMPQVMPQVVPQVVPWQVLGMSVLPLRTVHRAEELQAVGVGDLRLVDEGAHGGEMVLGELWIAMLSG